MLRLLLLEHCWLCQVLRGHYAYYGLPSNFRSLKGFLCEVRRTWFRFLSELVEHYRRKVLALVL